MEKSYKNEFVNSLVYPFKLGPALTLIAYSILFYLLVLMTAATYLVSFGSPIYLLSGYAWLIFINSYIEYCCEILEESSKDQKSVSILKLDAIIFLFGERRFLKQVFIVFLVFIFISEFYIYEYDFLFFPIIFLIALYFPASFSVTIIDSKILSSMNLFLLSKFITKIGKSYFFVVLIFYSILFLIYIFLTQEIKYVYLYLLLILYLCIVLFRFFGLLVYKKQDELFSIKKSSCNDFQEKEREELNFILSKLYKLVNVGEYDAATVILKNFLKSPTLDVYRELHQEISSWRNKKLALFNAKLFISKLIGANSISEVWGLCEWCLNINPQFTLDNASDLDTLIEFSMRENEKIILTGLLFNYAEKFKDSPFSIKFLKITINIFLEDLKNKNEAARILNYIFEIYPSCRNERDLRRLKTLLI